MLNFRSIFKKIQLVAYIQVDRQMNMTKSIQLDTLTIYIYALFGLRRFLLGLQTLWLGQRYKKLFLERQCHAFRYISPFKHFWSPKELHVLQVSPLITRIALPGVWQSYRVYTLATSGDQSGSNAVDHLVQVNTIYCTSITTINHPPNTTRSYSWKFKTIPIYF